MSNIQSPQHNIDLDLSKTNLLKIDIPSNQNQSKTSIPLSKNPCDGMFILSDKKEPESIYLPKKNHLNNNITSPQQPTEISIVSSNNLVLSSASNIQPIKVSSSNQLRCVPPSYVDHQMANGNFQFLSDVSNRPYYTTTTTNQQGLPTVVQLNQPQFISQIRPNMNSVATTSNQSMIIRPGIIQPRQIIGVLQPVSIRRSNPQTLISSVKLSDSIQSNPDISSFPKNNTLTPNPSLLKNNSTIHTPKPISKPQSITPKLSATEIGLQENENKHLTNGNKSPIINYNQNIAANQKKRPITTTNHHSVTTQNSLLNSQLKKRKFNPILIAEKPLELQSQSGMNINNRPVKPIETVEDKPKDFLTKKTQDDKKKIESSQDIVNQLIDKLKSETKHIVSNPPMSMKEIILPPIGYRNKLYFDENLNRPTDVNYRAIKYNQGGMAVSLTKDIVLNLSSQNSQNEVNYQDDYLLNHVYMDPNLNLCTFKKAHSYSEKIFPSSPVAKDDEDQDFSKIFWTVKNTERDECSSPLLEEGCSIITKKNLDVSKPQSQEKSDANINAKPQEALRISFLPISLFLENLQNISNMITSIFKVPSSSTFVDTSSAKTADMIIKPQDSNGIKFSFDDKILKELDTILRKNYGFQSVHFSIDFLDKIKSPAGDTQSVRQADEKRAVSYPEQQMNLNSLIIASGGSTGNTISQHCSNCSQNLDINSLVTFKLMDLFPTFKSTEDSCQLMFCSTNCHQLFMAKVNEYLPHLASTVQSDNVELTRISLVIDKPANRIPIFLQPMNLKISKYLSRVNNNNNSPIQLPAKQKNPRWNYFTTSLQRSLTSKDAFHQKTQLPEESLIKLRESYLFNSPHTDKRACILCKHSGDMLESESGRLLSLDIDRFIHLNCIIWCFDVYESVSGSLHNVHHSIEKAAKTSCAYCGDLGAGLPCYHTKCSSIYHVPCAIKVGCMFFTDRGMYCDVHQPQEHPMQLKSLEALRKIYIQREDNPLVAAVINDEDQLNRIRIGNVILNRLGQLLPQHLESGNFNTKRYIYPVGFSTTRIYWSMRKISTRSKYIFEIRERDNSPIFHVTEVLENHPNEEIIGESCDEVCQIILTRVANLRRDMQKIKLFPEKIKGEDFFGMTKSQIIRAIESFPGTDLLNDYCFNFGRMELIADMPLALNPSGCARSEPRYRPLKYSNRTASNSVYCDQQNQPTCSSQSANSLGSVTQLQNTTLSGRRTNVSIMSHENKFTSANKCQQYRRLKTETANNVILGRSGIQGFGLFAARDLEPHSMVIEYIGELIRNELANKREKIYESHNRGIYMFRLDENTVIDATMTGGLARYINHSCSPNCYTEFINTSDGTDGHIVIMTNRKIPKGEELSYDYKFDFEDCTERIPCLCGAPACKKWMN